MRKREPTMRLHPDLAKLLEVIIATDTPLDVPLIFGPDPTGQAEVFIEIGQIDAGADTNRKPHGLRVVGGTDTGTDSWGV
jgi:hypothetical protein